VAFSLPPDLEAALAALADRFEERDVEWVVTGGVARALAGFSATPGDLDVEVDEAAAHRAAAAAGLRAARETAGTASSIRGRGAWQGIDLDVTGGLALHGPGGHLHADFPLMRAFAMPAEVAGRTVWAAPVEEQIARAVVAGDERRLDRIADERPRGFAVDGFYLSVRLAAASASR
jgi:hypothetical protein